MTHAFIADTRLLYCISVHGLIMLQFTKHTLLMARIYVHMKI